MSMAGKKESKSNTKTGKKLRKVRSTDRYFKLILIVFSFLLYGNTILNEYSLDDYHISSENSIIKKGFEAIPDIFGSKYAVESGMEYGYRALTRLSFAIEYELFGEGTVLGNIVCEISRNLGMYTGSSCNMSPYISHFFNVVLYTLLLLFLFRFLRRIFKDFHPWLAFVVVMIFAAHPVHTEVVASLKNRDELLNMIFMILAVEQFIRYADFERRKHLIFGGIYLVAAVLAKETAAAFFMMIPFTLYFFTSMKLKRVIVFTLLILSLGVLATFGPFIYLSMFDRPLGLEENPLMHQDGFLTRIAYGGYILYYYVRLLVFPHPLLYYYGYDTIPLQGFGNPLVILGLIFHLGIFIYAIINFRKQNILSYAILIYLGSIAMFTNIVKPAPGIIADRWLFAPSLGFSVALGYGIFRIFTRSLAVPNLEVKKLFFIGLILALILTPYTVKTIVRNKDWNTEFTLYQADMPYLWNSVKANDLYANELMEWVNKELAKPVNVTKFIEPQIQESYRHYERAAEILPEYYSAWNSLGIIQSRIYKKYDDALIKFHTALQLKPGSPQTWFNIAQAYEGLGRLDSAILYYKKNIELDPNSINTRSRLANIHFQMGAFKEAIELNQEITRIDPEEALPFVNIGNYYFLQGDTTTAITFYERAVEKNAPAVVSKFLSEYYQGIGNLDRAEYFGRISNDLQRREQYFIPGKD